MLAKENPQEAPGDEGTEVGFKRLRREIWNLAAEFFARLELLHPERWPTDQETTRAVARKQILQGIFFGNLVAIAEADLASDRRHRTVFGTT
jgi:hypothetical protein